MSNKPRLLIADDSPLVRKELSDILEDEYELIEAENGEEAWTMIREDKTINMVLTDLTMPNVDGLTLLKRIRANADESVRSLPVVMMTEASDDLIHVKESLASGVTDLVRKPFIPELLRARANANIRPRQQNQFTITATVDPLTQLANEPYFMLRGSNNLSYAARHNEGFGVLLIKIDKFEELCRQFDAYVMENVQVKIGSYIQSVVRAEDTVARLEDGTFGVLLLGVGPRGVLETAARVHKKVKKKIIRYNDQRFSVTVSIGAAAPVLKLYSSFELILRQVRAELKKAYELGDTIEAENINKRLEGNVEDSQYVPSIDEALAMLANNQGNLLTHCAEELFVKLLPLLIYCDDKMELNLVAQLKEKFSSRPGETVI
jgi:diguanylate cyclase (GGDEF)-like protein